MKALIRRLFAAIPTVLIASLVIFGLQSLIPGGPGAALVGPDATPEAMDAINQRLGLNNPFFVRYWDWLWSALQGDLGRSYRTQQPVIELIGQRLEPTLQIAVVALIIAVVVGGTIGMWSAIRSDRLDGRILLALSGAGLAVPNFWMAALSVGFFGLYLAVLPVGGFVSMQDGFQGNIRSILMPSIILSVHSSVLIGLQLRGSMIATLRSTHVRTARAVGLPPRTIYFNYALRASLSPVITYLPLVFASLVGASTVVETVFNIPGLGLAIVQAINSRDYPTLQGIVLALVLAVVVLNVVADAVLIIVDPRLRHRMEAN